MSSSNTAYAVQSGTSMATPHVAGAWAVLKQVNPTASVQQVLAWLYQSGVSITDNRNGVQLPRISLFAAINTAEGYPAVAVTVTNTPTATFTATNTPTATATFTVTNTPTVTPTFTVTNTPTVTSTATNTSQPTRTRTTTHTRTPLPKPGAFYKVGPVDLAVRRALPVTLTWSASTGVQQYEYCIATTGPACTNWKNVGLNRRVIVYGLMRNTTYVWQVRARNVSGLTTATDGRWRFTTIR
jgi:hypothetical protein